MKKWLLSVAIGMVLLASCSSSPSVGGGFETSDLSALVVDSNGTAVPSARVWLLSDRGDSMLSLPLDSMASDTKGFARFKPSDNPVFGFEAWSLDSSMAVVVRGLRPPLTTPVRLVLQPTRVLTLPCMYWAESFVVAGSHFVQNPPVCIGLDSFKVMVPAGAGNILALPPPGVSALPQVIPFLADSLPYYHPLPSGPKGPPSGPGLLGP